MKALECRNGFDTICGGRFVVADPHSPLSLLCKMVPLQNDESENNGKVWEFSPRVMTEYTNSDKKFGMSA